MNHYIKGDSHFMDEKPRQRAPKQHRNLASRPVNYILRDRVPHTPETLQSPRWLWPAGEASGKGGLRQGMQALWPSLAQASDSERP